MSTPVNKIIVSISEYRIETASGFQLIPEVEFKPEMGEPVCGIVVNDQTILNHAGAKRFYEDKKGIERQYPFSAFSNFLQKGDKVYFMYQAGRQEQWMWEDKDYWIPFDDVLFYERDGVLYAADGIILVKPIEIKEKFMEYETVTGEHKDRGEVVAIGNPLKGQSDLGVSVGDVVVFNPKMVDKNMTYKGAKIWAVDLDSVLCVL